MDVAASKVTKGTRAKTTNALSCMVSWPYKRSMKRTGYYLRLLQGVSDRSMSSFEAMSHWPHFLKPQYKQEMSCLVWVWLDCIPFQTTDPLFVAVLHAPQPRKLLVTLFPGGIEIKKRKCGKLPGIYMRAPGPIKLSLRSHTNMATANSCFCPSNAIIG